MTKFLKPLIEKRNPLRNDQFKLFAYLGLLITVISWGLIPVFQKKLLSVMSPIEVTFSRFFLTSLFLSTWVIVKKQRELLNMIRGDFLILMLSTFIGPLFAMALFNYGIETISIGLAAILIAFEPVLTYIFAVGAKQERWSGKRMLSIIMALLGLILIVYQDDRQTTFWVGFAFVATSTAVWALNTILTKKLVVKYNPVVMMTYNFCLGSLFLLPFLGNQYLNTMIQLNNSLWFDLLFCVIPGTVFGFSIWYVCLKYISPSSVSISLYLIPVFSFLGGLIFFDEAISVMKISGFIIALWGLYLVNIKFNN